MLAIQIHEKYLRQKTLFIMKAPRQHIKFNPGPAAQHSITTLSLVVTKAMFVRQHQFWTFQTFRLTFFTCYKQTDFIHPSRAPSLTRQ